MVTDDYRSNTEFNWKAFDNILDYIDHFITAPDYVISPQQGKIYNIELVSGNTWLTRIMFTHRINCWTTPSTHDSVMLSSCSQIDWNNTEYPSRHGYGRSFFG